MTVSVIERPAGAGIEGGAPFSAVHIAAPPGPAEAHDLLDALNRRAGRCRPVLVDRLLVLYGAGNLGKLARAYLDAVRIPIALVVDAGAAQVRHDPDWAGIDIVEPDAVPHSLKRDALLAVSIVNSPFVPLRSTLERAGWAHCVPFYDIAEGLRDRHPLSNGWFAAQLDATVMQDVAHVLTGWADDASRAHHLRFMAWRLAREEWDITGAAVDPTSRFFIPEIRAALTAHERVLDGGAHHGTYLARMLSDAGLARAWAIEPDPQNRAVLENWAATLDPAIRRRIEILDSVLGANETDLPFHEGLGYASQIAATGRRTRRTVPIDRLGLDPSVIKLHLEGAELATLEGARETIRQHRPVIMATVYHNDDGLARTPLWLMRTLENYRLFMRTHSWCGTGAVVYAVPRERCGDRP